jgi:hypothetical protein
MTFMAVEPPTGEETPTLLSGHVFSWACGCQSLDRGIATMITGSRLDLRSGDGRMALMKPQLPLPFSDVLPPELEADTKAVLDKLMTGKPVDPETRERIYREAARIREKLHRKYGELDIGVPAIRELRDA